MAKQIRYGDFSQFHPEKMVTAELAVVTSGDPNAESGRSVYVCFVPGVVKRLTTYEDFQMELSSVSEEIRSEFTEDITSSIQNALLATTAANNAAEAAQAATTAANNAAEAAMDYVLGDISEKTVTFETATQRAGIESGDSLAVAFGKLAKFCSDIDQHSFNPLANNLTTNTEGYGMDARQGPVIAQKISNVETSVNQLNTKMGNAVLPRGQYDNDLDDLKIPGAYLAFQCAHKPDENPWGTCIVFAGGTGAYVQIYATVHSRYYIRHNIAGATGWLTWKEL